LKQHYCVADIVHHLSDPDVLYEIISIKCERQGLDKQSYYYEDIADLRVIQLAPPSPPHPLDIMHWLNPFWRKDIRPKTPEPTNLNQVMLQYWTDCEKKEHWCVFVLHQAPPPVEEKIEEKLKIYTLKYWLENIILCPPPSPLHHHPVQNKNNREDKNIETLRFVI
ncbi:hypothetical protein EB093_09480, partial [bacterium]|nr:hypothetical protein [bacterium]